MRPRRRKPLPTGQAGMGLVEMTISISLVFALLGIVYTTAEVIGSVNRSVTVQARRENRTREVLNLIAAELRNSSTDRDPATFQTQYQILNQNGRPLLRFRKIIGATFDNGELAPLWSADIEYTLDAEGNLTRTDSGKPATVLGSGFMSLDFRVSESGDFEIDAVAVWNDEETGQPKTERCAISIRPAN